MTAALMRIVALSSAADPAWRARLAATFDLWFPAYAMAALTLATAIVVAPMTGHSLDLSGVANVLEELSGLLVLALLGMLGWRFVAIARARPPEGPTRALGRWLVGLVTARDRWLHTLHTLAVVSIFAISFGLLKGAIALLSPFAWDVAFMELDRLLHGGRLAHEWLGGIIASPLALLAINFVYNLWYFIVLGALVLAGVNAGGAGGPRHLRFVTAFIALWLFGGFFMAMGFSSAGPCFVGPLGLAADYDGLMAALRAADAELQPAFKLWALGTQDMLLAGHLGERDGTLGISALPSMHVATATLLALYVQGFGRRAAIGGWLFAAAIMLGSVVLAWHYAVDGYAGALVAWCVWWATGRVLERRGMARRRMVRAQS